MREYKVFCPFFDETCPYCNKDNECGIEEPEMECDDFFAEWIEQDDPNIFFDFTQARTNFEN